MTAIGLIGPSLNEDQWRQIKAIATSLKPEQALWLSGYFAGYADGGRAETLDPLPLGALPGLPAGAPAATAATRTLTILYGSETGNGAGVARLLAEKARSRGLEPVLADMADYKPRRLKEEQDLLIVASTHGEGDPPLSGMGFFEFVEGRKAPRLEGVRYAVLALGDSTYEHFCGAGKRLDKRLAELGATQLAPRVDCDVDYDEPAAAFVETVLDSLGPSPQAARLAAAPIPAAAPASAFDKRNPFAATVIDNVVLTGRGSSKETRHVELALDGSGLSFQPGDALGMLPRNDPALVASLLDTLSLSPGAPVAVKERATTLGDALAQDFEIVAATPRFIDHWAALSGVGELEALRGEANAPARAAYLRTHHVIDIVRRFPVAGIDAENLVAGLRPLQPRLYSIASSAAAAPDEVHLTVSTVRYALHGEPRTGVATGHLAARAEPDAALPVYVQPNPHFRLPDDDAPIIMIGAGTGVAPFRAFLQEREARGASGKSWLFFGERNFDSDFLYQTEWQGFLKDGVLLRMNVAFSRDGAEKTYVQHRLAEHGADVHAWLEEGAHLYVCGDGAKLAPDVHAALVEIVRTQKGGSKAAAADYVGALQNDRRYHIDVY
ncbi:MAG: assimilatory sulfite reductase (NADPH) flavoprotein subunit [Rhizobiales bacterium]|nr:assimilatory sulfite reductase (NADPH) flavoprotein subunit [Hyphomicrobiales bacterium]